MKMKQVRSNRRRLRTLEERVEGQTRLQSRVAEVAEAEVEAAEER